MPCANVPCSLHDANALASAVYVLVPTFGGLMAGRLVDDAGKAAFRPTWGALVASEARKAGSRKGRLAAGLDAALSFGEALGPLLAAVIWDLWGFVAFFAVRAGLGVATEVVLGRRLRAESRRPAGDARATLRPGAGRLTFREVSVPGALARVSIVAEPRRITAVRAADRAGARALVDVATGAVRPVSGGVSLDGQDISQFGPSAVQRWVRPLDLEPAQEDLSVGRALTRWWAGAPADELARVWALCGLSDRVGPLPGALGVPVKDLDQHTRRLLSLAASLVGDPAVLIVEHAGEVPSPMRAVVDGVVASHLGSVLVLETAAPAVSQGLDECPHHPGQSARADHP